MPASKFTTAQARKLAENSKKFLSMTFHELDPIWDFELEEGEKLLWSVQSILIQRGYGVEYTVGYHEQEGNPPTIDEKEFTALLKRSVEYNEDDEEDETKDFRFGVLAMRWTLSPRFTVMDYLRHAASETIFVRDMEDVLTPPRRKGHCLSGPLTRDVTRSVAVVQGVKHLVKYI
ncbi:hypothetical protein BKA70DRAFT_1221841 [Coprinopsis sp. MPI-PUGE-AT-0042]|nr:hypothetical protein BKA70DRAFT_1221841 [Coprinopsis sp. MPI-PUGE-AT-0042]